MTYTVTSTAFGVNREALLKLPQIDFKKEVWKSAKGLRGSIVGIDLLDHIIFNRAGYFSFLEEGQL